METLHGFIKLINGYLWGPPMLIALFGTHLILTFRLRFIQRYMHLAIKLSLAKDTRGKGDISHFGALTTALAATIGTGNIVGVATAVALGGPGAVLWCWLTGVFGISTKYAEALLGIKYRQVTKDGTMLGGPMYALEKGLNMKWLAVLFCIFTSMAAFGIGNMVQSNAIAKMMEQTFNITPYISGIVLAVLVAIVILGGIKSIAKVCERLVPFMAVVYVLGCITVLIINAKTLLPALELIISSAFSGSALGGGMLGAGIMVAARYGIARGLFSNESGLGSAPIVAAAAKTNNPVKQALVSSSATFWDTVVVCALTGLALVSTIIKDPAKFQGLDGPSLSHATFSVIPLVGPVFLTISLFTFVLSTILGWSYYGERSIEYLFGKTGIKPYRYIWILAVFTGAVVSVPFVWDLSDSMNALMAIPNLITLLLLTKVVVDETRKYLWEGNIDAIARDETF